MSLPAEVKDVLVVIEAGALWDISIVVFTSEDTSGQRRPDSRPQLVLREEASVFVLKSVS